MLLQDALQGPLARVSLDGHEHPQPNRSYHMRMGVLH